MSYVMLGETSRVVDFSETEGTTVEVPKIVFSEDEGLTITADKPSPAKSAFPWLLLLAASTYLW